MKKPSASWPFRQRPEIWRTAMSDHPATSSASGSQQRRPSIRWAGDRPWPHVSRLHTR
ncbi:MAG TPA: hypothetical protein VIL16_31425 [Trebonia sp.]